MTTNIIVIYFPDPEYGWKNNYTCIQIIMVLFGKYKEIIYLSRINVKSENSYIKTYKYVHSKIFSMLKEEWDD